MRPVRAVVRAARAAVGLASRPAPLGMLYVGALAALARAPSTSRRASVAILAAAIAFGALVGLLAGLARALRARMARRPAGSRVELLLGCAAIHAWCTLRAMAEAPEVFAGACYARGGFLRTVQVLATGTLGPRGVDVVFLLVLVVYLAGPRSQWPSWPGRLSRALLPRFRRVKPARAAASALGATLLLAVAWLAPRIEPLRTAAASSPETSRPNVLLLAVDSMREDQLERRIAPSLASLAERGTRFERAYVATPIAIPSWVTLLTGRYPHHHGVRSPLSPLEARAFDAVPARLAAAGYATAEVTDDTSDLFRRADFGFGRIVAPGRSADDAVARRALEAEWPLAPILGTRLGRRALPAARKIHGAADPSAVADDAIAALDTLARQPFFLTVTFASAGPPYAARAPYYRRFTDPAYRGRFKYGAPDPAAHLDRLDPRDVAQLRGLHDGAIAAVDAAAARILGALVARGLGERTIVILTAARGEPRVASGTARPDPLVGDEATHVPLVIFDPAAAQPRREGQVARDVDLAATIYERTGTAPPPDLDGRPLSPPLRGEPLAPAFAFAEAEAAAAPALRLPCPPNPLDPCELVARHRMVRDQRWKLVYAPARTGVTYMLFDTASDPDEAHDLAAANSAQVGRLRSELWGWLLRDPSTIDRDDYLVPRAGEAP